MVFSPGEKNNILYVFYVDVLSRIRFKGVTT